MDNFSNCHCVFCLWQHGRIYNILTFFCLTLFLFNPDFSNDHICFLTGRKCSGKRRKCCLPVFFCFPNNVLQIPPFQGCSKLGFYRKELKQNKNNKNCMQGKHV